MSKKPNGKRLNLENGLIFHGFQSLYEQGLEIKDELLYSKAQDRDPSVSKLNYAHEGYVHDFGVCGHN